MKNNETSLSDIYNPANQANVSEVLNVIVEAVNNKSSFSLLRYGDGEGFLSGYPDITDESEYSLILRLWWGEHIPSEEPDLKNLRKALASSVTNCDILGVPHVSSAEKFKKALKVLDERNLIRQQKITSSNIHIELYKSQQFADFLASLDFVGLVTCRDIADTISQKYNIEKVILYAIPEEAAYARGHLSDVHYPDRYNELRNEIEVPFPGAVFLVGAGVCGKIYCDWIKQRGGVAIDIGSVFDLWANRLTRAYMRAAGIATTGKDWELDKYKSSARKYASVGKYSDAIKEQLRALEVAPYDPLVYFELSQYYVEVSELDNALKFAKKAHDYRPDNPHLKEHYDNLKAK